MNAVHIDFPLDVTTWQWSTTTGRWLRSYSDTGLAVQGDGVQISAANVVILHVVEYRTPYLEDANGAREYQLQLTGTGPAWIFRDGREFQGTWRRLSLTQSATFVEANGTEITLSPGNTWEELVPTVSPVTVSGLAVPAGRGKPAGRPARRPAGDHRAPPRAELAGLGVRGRHQSSGLPPPEAFWVYNDEPVAFQSPHCGAIATGTPNDTRYVRPRPAYALLRQLATQRPSPDGGATA